MLMGILDGYHEAADKTKNTWACAGNWNINGQDVRGYGLIIDGRLAEVIDPDLEDAIELAIRKVREHARHYQQPYYIRGVGVGVGPFVVMDSAPYPRPIKGF